MNDIKKLTEYLYENFSEEEVIQSFERNCFDMQQLDERNLKRLSKEETRNLFTDVVYIAMNELFGGDFETMYDILYSLNIGEETIQYALDF